MKRLTITATLLLTITISTGTSFLAPALAQVVPSFPAKPYDEIVGVEVTPDAYTYFPDVYATVKIEVTVKNFNNFSISENLPVMINGNETNVSVHITLASGEEKTFNTTAELWGGGEMTYLPTFAASHIDYTINVGGVEKTVAIHPNRTSLLFVGFVVLILIVFAYFANKGKTYPPLQKQNG